MTPERDSYTAKLTSGPLEGKTVSTRFLESGDPQPRLEIPVGGEGKRLVYVRAAGVEYAEDDPEHARPSAVDYRFLESTFG